MTHPIIEILQHLAVDNRTPWQKFRDKWFDRLFVLAVVGVFAIGLGTIAKWVVLGLAAATS